VSDTRPPISERGPTVGGIVLAAGRSTRYGPENKLLTPVSGTAMVERAATTAVESGLEAVVAVVGHHRKAVSDALSPTVDGVEYNDRYAAGQSASVRHGVAIARERDWDAVVFMLGDMPFVDPATVDRLRHVYGSTAASIVVPRHEGERGNPVVFGHRHFGQLANLTGDRGGRELLLAHEDTRFVDVADPGVTLDIDTRRDRAAYLGSRS